MNRRAGFRFRCCFFTVGFLQPDRCSVFLPCLQHSAGPVLLSPRGGLPAPAPPPAEDPVRLGGGGRGSPDLASVAGRSCGSRVSLLSSPACSCLCQQTLPYRVRGGGPGIRAASWVQMILWASPEVVVFMGQREVVPPLVD